MMPVFPLCLPVMWGSHYSHSKLLREIDHGVNEINNFAAADQDIARLAAQGIIIRVGVDTSQGSVGVNMYN